MGTFENQIGLMTDKLSLKTLSVLEVTPQTAAQIGIKLPSHS
jgi:hypothetical protein